MTGNNVGYELPNDMHGERIGFAPFSPAAVAHVSEIVPPGTWMGRRQFRGRGACGDVLAFGLLTVRPAPRVEAQLPAIASHPFERFLREQLAGVHREDAQFEIEP